MASIARILALSGVVLLAIGAFIPVMATSGTACGEGAFLGLNCFEDGFKEGFIASHVGIFLVLLAASALLPALKRRPAGLWVFGLMVTGVVVVLWFFVDSLRNDSFSVIEIDWGWGALFSSAALLLLGALFSTFNAAANRR